MFKPNTVIKFRPQDVSPDGRLTPVDTTMFLEGEVVSDVDDRVTVYAKTESAAGTFLINYDYWHANNQYFVLRKVTTRGTAGLVVFERLNQPHANRGPRYDV